MKLYFRAFWNGLIPPELRRDGEVLRRANRVAAFHLAMLVWVPIFAVIYTLLGATLSSNIILCGGIAILGGLLLLGRGVSPGFCGNLLCGAAWTVYTGLTLFTGGASAPVMVWYASLPVLSTLLAGTRSGVVWTTASVVTVTALCICAELGFQLPNEISASGIRLLRYTGLVGLLVCVFVLVCVLKQVEQSAQEALHEANRCLEQQASIDGMTGIPNRRSFDWLFEQEWKRHLRTNLPLSIALLDVDFFKQYNDVFGHLAGDDCLRSIAQAIQTSLRRPGDFVARYGGEEFALILPNTDQAGAARLAEAIRMHVRGLQIPHSRSSVSRFVTISIGMTTCVPHLDDSQLDFLHDADVALYRAKANGRNQSMVVTPSSVQLQAVRAGAR